MANLTRYIGGQTITAADGTTQESQIVVISLADFNALGANLDENTLYLITA